MGSRAFEAVNTKYTIVEECPRLYREFDALAVAAASLSRICSSAALLPLFVA